jgi:hypothetical protein
MVFWDVTDPDRTVIVSLNHERYEQLIIEVDDPPTVVSRLQGRRRCQGPCRDGDLARTVRLTPDGPGANFSAP